MPSVSVIIPNYNYGRYLPDAIDSVLAQDYTGGDIEIIVVDDGSTDDSRAVIDGYGEKIRPLFQENQGYAAAFNTGIGHARGEFLVLLDADDVMLPARVRRVVESFDSAPDAGVVSHFMQDTDAEMRPLEVTFPDWPPRAKIEDYLEGNLQLAGTTAISFRREVIKKALPIPTEFLTMYADSYLIVHALFQGPGVNIAEVLSYRRVHGQNACADSYWDPAKIAADFRMRSVFQERLERMLEKHGRKLSPRFKRQEDLELFRREILFHMHEGHRGRAIAAWGKGFARFALHGFGYFRLATTALALISLRLYLGLYTGYERARSASA